MNTEEKKKIVDILSKKGVTATCPMCHQDKLTMTDKYISNPIEDEIENEYSLGGPSIPTVLIICGNCGFTSQHAIGVLGLLNQQANTNNQEQANTLLRG